MPSTGVSTAAGRTLSTALASSWTLAETKPCSFAFLIVGEVLGKHVQC